MSIRKSELPLFVACLPGLEPMLAEELGRFGAGAIEPDAGGVSCRGGLETVYRINLCSGLATHVLVRIASFHARRLPELRRKAEHVAWGEWLSDRGVGGPAVTVRAACRKTRLYHTGAVEQRISEAIRAALGIEVVLDHGPGGTAADALAADARAAGAHAADEHAADARAAGAHAAAPSPLVAVRLFQDWCTISLDTSGEPLHRRGWRLESAKAPLREDLAHALLLRSGWDCGTPLVDPMVGSGTILIEGAALARGLPPGRLRSFGWHGTRLDDRDTWRAVRDAALARALDRAPARILGSDRDAGAIAAAGRNAERAGVAEDLELDVAALRDAPGLGLGASFAAGAVVSNPPYGRRIGEGDRLVPLYQALGRRLSALPPAWHVALCAADRRLALRTGLPLATGFLTAHGGLKVRALVRRGSGFAKAASASASASAAAAAAAATTAARTAETLESAATADQLPREGHAEEPRS